MNINKRDDRLLSHLCCGHSVSSVQLSSCWCDGFITRLSTVSCLEMPKADFPEQKDQVWMWRLAQGHVSRTAAFLLELTAYISASKIILKRKIPISTDIGSSLAIFFLSQAVTKTTGHPESIQEAFAATRHGIPICFSSTANLEIPLRPNNHLEITNENNSAVVSLVFLK